METSIWMVLLLAALPALGNFSGAALAEWRPPSKTTINRALHAATGIILAVVAVEVMPRALRSTPAWQLAAALTAGGGLYLLVEAAIERWQQSKPGGKRQGTGVWMVYVAVATDLVGDGLLIGREAHTRAEDSRWSALSLILGFAGFLVVSGSLG